MLKKGHNSKNNQHFQKVKNTLLEHHFPNVFANFQREILITAEATLTTNYKRTYGKKSKRAITHKKIKI